MAKAKPNSKEKLAIEERRVKVLKLRAQGFTTREIAKKVGVESHATVLSDLKAGFAELAAENKELSETLRDKQQLEIDRLKVALLESVEKGNESAINAYRQLLDREAKLWGLDSSEKHDHSGKVEFEITYVKEPYPDESSD